MADAGKAAKESIKEQQDAIQRIIQRYKMTPEDAEDFYIKLQHFGIDPDQFIGASEPRNETSDTSGGGGFDDPNLQAGAEPEAQPEETPGEETEAAPFEITDELVDQLLTDLGDEVINIDREEFKTGLKMEQEHQDITNNDPMTTARIALAHIKEISDYYTRLIKMEADAKQEENGAEGEEPTGGPAGGEVKVAPAAVQSEQ